MPLDTSIPLSVRPYEAPSPIQSIGSLMQLKGMGADIALKQAEQQRAQQQTEEFRATAEQRNRDLQAQRNLQTVLADPANHGAFAAGDFSAIHRAAPPTIALPAITSLQQMREKALTLQKEQSARYAEGRGLLAKTIEGLDPADDAKAADQFNTAIQTLGQEHPELAAKLQPIAPGPDFRQRVKDLAAGNSVARAILEDAAGLKKTETETAAKQAEADLTTAKIPGATAESEKQRLVTDAMKGAMANPQAGEQSIKDALPLDPTAASAYTAAWRAKMAAGDVQGAAEEVGKAAAHNALISQAVNPTMRAGKAATAAAEATAKIPAEVAQATAVEKAKAALSSDAFSGIVDPYERHQTETLVSTAAKDYITKASEARRLKDLIAAAQNGNKAAPGVIPIEELRGFVNRVNSNELKAVSSGAGSLVDRIQGWVQGKTEGQPIPPDILADTAKLADLNEQAAERGYKFNLEFAKLKGAKTDAFSPEKLIGGSASKTVRARDPEGKLHEAPAGTPLPAGWKAEQ